MVLGTLHIVLIFFGILFNCNIMLGITALIRPIFPMAFIRLRTILAESFGRCIIWWCQVIGGLEITYYGDIEELERLKPRCALIISNHTSLADAPIIWVVADRVRACGKMRAVAKKALTDVPVIGWWYKQMKFIALSRSFEKDGPEIVKQFEHMKDIAKHHPFWLLIFPEGTRAEPKKQADAQDYAKKHDLYVPKHTLVPRVKGLSIALPILHDELDAVLDVTIGYPTFDSEGHAKPYLKHLMLSRLGRWPVHVHVRMIKTADVPKKEEEVPHWLMKAFEEKDKLLAEFATTGKFPGDVHERPGVRVVHLLLNLCFFGGLAVVCMFGLYAFVNATWSLFIVAKANP